MSSFGFEPVPLVAGGTIVRGRFIKLSTAADNTALQAGANAMVHGIAEMAPRDAPIDGADATTIAAATNSDPVPYIPEGNVCLLEIGTGGVTRGAEIKSDSDGTGILAATTGATKQWVGAIALETASAGEFARVQVKVYPHYPALS